MTQNKNTHASSHNGIRGIREFLFGDQLGSVTNYDVAITLLLMVFLFTTSISIAAMNISYGAAALLWIGRMAYRKRCDVPKTPFDMFLLAFVLAEGLSLIFSYNRPQSVLFMYRRVTLLPIMFVLLGNIRSKRMLSVFFWTLLASMVFVSLWSLRDVFFHLHEYILFQRRLREFQMYMTAGGMMMFALLLLLPFVLHPRTPKKIRWVALAALVPVGTNLLFTFTRSSWLGFLTGAIVIGAYRSKKIFLPLALIVVLVVTLSSSEMQERMSSIFNPYHPNNIIRLHMWETGLRMFEAHPIVGIGDIDIAQVWHLYAPPEIETVGHLHNNLVMWLVTLGSVGFIAIVALFVKLWMVMRGIEQKLHDDWFLGSVALSSLAVMAGFHVNGLFEWNFGDAEIIMVIWMMVGMTLAAEKVATIEATVG